MAIPDYQSLMLPVLKLASDGKEHKFSSAVEGLADAFVFCIDQSSRTPLIFAIDLQFLL